MIFLHFLETPRLDFFFAWNVDQMFTFKTSFVFYLRYHIPV
jgi:hypothetical protein